MELNQYSIVLVNLDPTTGSEIRKTRPCVIISPDEMNKFLKTIVVAPMTTTLKAYPTRVPVESNGKKGMIVIDQVRTIDKQRVLKVFDSLKQSEIDKCKEVLKETFVD
ncbi:MazF-like toxin of toxin/antitoxin addiction module, PemK superfamily [Psychroflexus torquis ATCC 700755]|jgi:mRNA interferase MazF|uniref:mRNA interferase n=1 Tax=Psychroflexus torquis (strain ATCC 700755 / CIP 106069 / ACAM 623) TaxID=313595 RepID=K4IHI8_PSYTT|nr:type II toxin-antitoxin system PemK/MazF family toxin [Psychroflexus torquis]AFU68511.1 MazF-like toxin of toxin/antitoxin addiction module, PemK superfamily [Psychroflexus torquis ATCC 700755]